MGQLGVEVFGLESHVAHPLRVGMAVNRAHERHVVDDHHDYHADVVGQREEQPAEVVGVSHAGARAELHHFGYAVDQGGDVFAPFARHTFCEFLLHSAEGE